MRNFNVKLKYAIIMVIAVGGCIVLDIVAFEEGKYLFVMAFGYLVNVSWKDNKPHKWVNLTWRFCKAFLFSLIGASILLKSLTAEIIWKALLTIIFGLIFRAISLLIFPTKRFSLKERIFMAIGILFFLKIKIKYHKYHFLFK